MSSDTLDAKLDRIGARVAARADDIRRELEAVGALEMAELCREVFSARLAYLRTPRVEHGADVRSVPYDLNIRGHANGAASVDGGQPPLAGQRSTDQPYLGRPNQGKRKARKPAGSRAASDSDLARMYSGRDRSAGPD